jgi:hypothetical protein
MWTDAAVHGGKARRITSFADLEGLVRAGLVTSATINPPGSGNSFVAGLRPARAIINCPVIAQSELPPQRGAETHAAARADAAAAAPKE